MRIAFVIVVLTAIAVGLVELRRQEVVFLHDAQRLEMKLLHQRQQSPALDLRLGRLTSVEALRARAQEMGIPLEAPGAVTAAARHESALNDLAND